MIGTEEIRSRIKAVIANVTAIDLAAIPNSASFRDDLQLDSLSLLEIAVDVDYEFKLGLPDEQLVGLATLDDAVALVERVLAKRDGAHGVA
jgi:acyl carrier protein